MRPSRRAAAVLLLALVASDRAAAQPRPPQDPLPPGAVLRLGSTALRHPRGAESVACSPDGAHVLSNGPDEVTLWEAATGKGRNLAGLTDSRPLGLAFSADGKQFAWDIGNTILLNETTGAKPLHRLVGHKSPLGQLVFSPDGKMLAGGGEDGIVCLWDSATGKIRHRLQGHTKAVQALAFTPDGKTLITGARDKSLRMWDVAAGQETRRINREHDTGGLALRVSPGGGELVVVEYGGHWGPAPEGNVIRRLDFNNGKELSRAAIRDVFITSAAVAPDGRSVALGPRTGLWCDNPISLVDATSGKELAVLSGHLCGVQSVAWSADGKTLVSGSIDRTVRVWDVAARRESGAFHGHVLPITAAAWSPDGKTLATGGKDHSICLWDAATGKRLHRLFGHQDWMRSLAFSPDGRTLVSCAYRHHVDAGTIQDTNAWLWNVATGERADAIKGVRGDVVFSPDGKTLATTNLGGNVAIWPVGGKEESRILGAEQRVFGAVAFSPDGKQLVAGEAWTGANVWDVSSGRHRYRLPREYQRGVRTLAYSPDGRYLAIGSVGEIALWEMLTGKEVLHWQTKSDDVEHVGFSPDGRLVMSGNHFRGTACFYDVSTGKLHHTIAKVGNGTTLAAYAPGGRALATGHADGTVLLWKPAAVKPPALPQVKHAPGKLEVLWDALAGGDAAAAYKARWSLATSPGQTLPLLSARLRPVAAPDAAAFAKLLADLESAQFKVRDRASAALAKYEDSAAGLLRKALEGKPPLEVRKRIEHLLARLDEPSATPETLRALRAVEVLERIGGAEARALLRELSGGAAGARLTESARAAGARLTAAGADGP